MFKILWKQRITWIFKILITIFIILGCTKKEQVSLKIQPQEEGKITKEEKKREKIKERKYVYFFPEVFEEKRDPFVKPSLPEDKLDISQIELVGFLWDKKERIAVIESKEKGKTYLLKENDIIGQTRVIKIDENVVWFEQKKEGVSYRHKLQLRREKEGGEKY